LNKPDLVIQTINLFFTAESSHADRTAALEQIQKWEAVRAARLLKGDAKDPDIRRMATLVVDSAVPAESLLTKLNELPLVEQATIPSQREIA
jgi:hypothetical protein